MFSIDGLDFICRWTKDHHEEFSVVWFEPIQLITEDQLMWLSLFPWTVKTYEDMTLEELDDNEDEFGEEDEAAIEMYRWVERSPQRLGHFKN